MAGLISWRSNIVAPLPLKAIYSFGGVFVSTLITHERFRSTLKHQIEAVLPEEFIRNYKIIDGKVGMFGAELWNKSEDLFHQAKSKVIKITRINK